MEWDTEQTDILSVFFFFRSALLLLLNPEKKGISATLVQASVSLGISAASPGNAKGVRMWRDKKDFHFNLLSETSSPEKGELCWLASFVPRGILWLGSGSFPFGRKVPSESDFYASISFGYILPVKWGACVWVEKWKVIVMLPYSKSWWGKFNSYCGPTYEFEVFPVVWRNL